MRTHRPTPTPRTPWGLAWAGAGLGLLATVVVFAPAHWLAAGIGQLTGQHIQLLNPRGSIWQGSAQLVLSGGSGSNTSLALPGSLSWRLRPTWGGVAAQISAECCISQPLQVLAQIQGMGALQWTLSDHQSRWPAELLAGLGTPWNTVQAKGQLLVSSTGLGGHWVQGRFTLAGQLQLDALQMSSRLSTVAPMGSYRLTLQGGANPQLTLATLEGSLQLAGQGQWVGDRLRFEGEASAAPDRVEALSNLLNIVGRRDGARSIIKLG